MHHVEELLLLIGGPGRGVFVVMLSGPVCRWCVSYGVEARVKVVTRTDVMILSKYRSNIGMKFALL